MSIANVLTILRIAMIPALIILFYRDTSDGYMLQAFVFLLAVLTDGIDGFIARKYKQVTVLGTFLDPLADKLLIMAAFVCLVELHKIPAWIVIIIIAREFAVTGLRAIKAAEGAVIPANRWGKVKTVTQILAILVVILHPQWRTYISYPLDLWSVYIATAVTVLSGLKYFLELELSSVQKL
ncbi:MAG: CDP-diacylglycerol--glycerol-3-phosphate 3-phosphatidyltransferase [Syntrophothermus sp.]|uniref:CDP-diacylglycerol--glycerol-3-phosphate 3-phosphatidyltransferase n=1 Tax=Syntrophothermus sp. TaxID=2736299 RepID=UPI00257B60E2|nr:CDP-diacylglycerol--glycerol-3-phosphate 3-phosphatidyltransferase [Syntrophothermus sp.]NSW83128.1 CDP-diacylglycerol--glycerol-3-phosphate 3-phosphatidyltransferase [Syntrophothermus sp.]